MLKLTVKLHAAEQNINRNQLQLRSGVTLPLLTRYWNNTTTEVRLDALERIAKALNVSPGELIMNEGEVMRRFGGAIGWKRLNEEDAA